jgi:hypothetical protein
MTSPPDLAFAGGKFLSRFEFRRNWGGPALVPVVPGNHNDKGKKILEG